MTVQNSARKPVRKAVGIDAIIKSFVLESLKKSASKRI